MNNNLKMDVFVSHGDDMLQTVVDQIRQTGAQYIRSGQKRVVWAQSQSESHVYKMPYNKHGIVDNAIEVLFYKVLTELRNKNAISNSDLDLFTKTEMSNGDLFTIKAERADFIGNVAVHGTPIQQTVLSDYNFTADYNRIQQILSEYFVAYDATIFKEPMNFGFVTRADRQHLVLLDAGSILPKVSMFGVNSQLKCPSCGRELVYKYDTIQAGNLNQIKAGLQVDGGIYSCSTAGCECNINDNNKLSINAAQQDLRVYDNYAQQNKQAIESIIAVTTGLYLPDRNGIRYGEYKRQLNNIFSSMNENLSEERCATSYALYIDHVGSTMVSTRDDVFGLVVEFKKETIEGTNISYEIFRNESGKLNGISPILLAWLYISIYVGLREKADAGTWARFMIPDGDVNRVVNELRGHFSSLNIQASDRDINLLCNDLKI